MQNGIKTAVADKTAKKHSFWLKFRPKTRCGANFGSLLGSKVALGWIKKGLKREAFFDLLPEGLSWGPQGAPSIDFWDHSGLIFKLFWDFWGSFRHYFGIKIAGQSGHNRHVPGYVLHNILRPNGSRPCAVHAPIHPRRLQAQLFKLDILKTNNRY